MVLNFFIGIVFLLKNIKQGSLFYVFKKFKTKIEMENDSKPI
jgi:hypothetical protein